MCFHDLLTTMAKTWQLCVSGDEGKISLEHLDLLQRVRAVANECDAKGFTHTSSAMLRIVDDMEAQARLVSSTHLPKTHDSYPE